MSLKVYNTLTRKKEEFVPGIPGQVRIYACGPTTYNYIHLGNARALVIFDTIRRYLIYRGYQVTFVQNFTDIDDKIINRARDEGEEPLALAERYIKEYFRDAGALRVLKADVHPRATEHIQEMIQMVQVLCDRGVAYQEGGDVYFSVRKFPGYGKLSGRTLEEMQAGARVEVDQSKHDPMDFVLWKAAKPGEPSWDSPWGPGRPGWHLECSVMSIKYLGFGFDIHGGGSDLIFPHHENEIAQAEAYAGRAPFARYWIHNGFVTVNDEKMSKSLGNFFIVRDLLQDWAPEVLRFFLLSTHYRSPLDYNLDNLKSAQKSFSRLRNTVELLEEVLAREPESAETTITAGLKQLEQQVRSRTAEFEAAMDDDFNTALALSALFNLGREINSFINSGEFRPVSQVLQSLKLVHRTYTRLLDVVGLVPGESRELSEEQGQAMVRIAAGLIGEVAGLEKYLDDQPAELLQRLLNIRQEARKNKNFQLSDRLRDSLKEAGIILEDTPRGVRWRLV